MVFSCEYITKSPEETQRIGKELAYIIKKRQKKGGRVVKKIGKKAVVVCLYGDLGSGKTIFAQGFAKGLGIKSVVPSPTFIIVRHYNLPLVSKSFYHIDLYRICNKREIGNLGILEFFCDPSSYIIIEWAERLEKYLPKHGIRVKIEKVSDIKRRIRIIIEDQ